MPEEGITMRSSTAATLFPLFFFFLFSFSTLAPAETSDGAKSAGDESIAAAQPGACD
jgi:hypothetical protein